MLTPVLPLRGDLLPDFALLPSFSRRLPLCSFKARQEHPRPSRPHWWLQARKVGHALTPTEFWKRAAITITSLVRNLLHHFKLD